MGPGGWAGVRLPSGMRQEHTLGCGGSHRAPAESWQASWHWRGMYRSWQNPGGRKRRLSRTRPAPVTAGGAAGPKHGSDPRRGDCSGQQAIRGSWRVQRPTRDSPQTVLPTAPHTWTGRASSAMRGDGRELALGFGEQPQGRICCGLRGGGPSRLEGGERGGTPSEEGRAAVEASRVRPGPSLHCSLSPHVAAAGGWPTEDHREAGSLCLMSEPRGGPGPGVPSERLLGRAIEKGQPGGQAS